MIDLALAAAIGIFAALGGVFIKDMKALLIFTTLLSVVAFSLAFILGMATIPLGLLGLATSIVKVAKYSRRVVGSRVKTYIARRRLAKLEESVRTLPENIIDIVPAGSRRAVHPLVVQMVSIANEAYMKGYAVEEPEWLSTVRHYLAALGPEASADKTKVISEHEVVELD